MAKTKESELVAVGRAVLTAGVLVGGIACAAWLWPSGVEDVPLASLTLSMIARAVGAILVVPIALWAVLSINY